MTYDSDNIRDINIKSVKITKICDDKVHYTKIFHNKQYFIYIYVV